MQEEALKNEENDFWRRYDALWLDLYVCLLTKEPDASVKTAGSCRTGSMVFIRLVHVLVNASVTSSSLAACCCGSCKKLCAVQGHLEEVDAVATRVDVAARQLDNLRQTSVLEDCFHIWCAPTLCRQPKVYS